jgi:hypothetical protein
VSGTRHPGLLILAASICGLPGTLAAQTDFTIRTPIARAPSSLAISLGNASSQTVRTFAPATINAGAWEVTIGFDAARCEIYCEYRKKPHVLTTTLLPPVTEITVYSDSGAIPTTLTIDPAGLKNPVIKALASIAQPELDRTKLRKPDLTQQHSASPPRPSAHPIPAVRNPETSITLLLSLRI